MRGEAENISTDDLPTIVILIQLIRLVVCEVVAGKVITKDTKLQRENMDNACVMVCTRCMCVNIRVGVHCEYQL